MSVVSGGGGYGEKTYWDQRYANEDKYEWYLSYGQFKPQLLPHLDVADYPSPSASDGRRARSSVAVLVVGCGNSELSKQLFDDGFTDLHSIDYSEVVIDKMNQTYSDTPELKCQPASQPTAATLAAATQATTHSPAHSRALRTTDSVPCAALSCVSAATTAVSAQSW